jgi:chromosome segregation ATPase
MDIIQTESEIFDIKHDISTLASVICKGIFKTDTPIGKFYEEYELGEETYDKVVGLLTDLTVNNCLEPENINYLLFEILTPLLLNLKGGIVDLETKRQHMSDVYAHNVEQLKLLEQGLQYRDGIIKKNNEKHFANLKHWVEKNVESEKKLNFMKEQLKEKENEIKRLSQDVSTYSLRTLTLEQNITNEKKLNKKLQNDLKNSNKKLDDLTQSSNLKIENFNSQIQNLNSQIQHLKNQNKQLSDDVSINLDFKNKYDKLKAEFDKIKTQLDKNLEYKSKFDNVNIQLSYTLNIKTQLENQIKKIKQQFDDENNSKDVKIQELHSTIDSNLEIITSKNKMIETLEDKVKHNLENENLIKENENLIKELKNSFNESILKVGDKDNQINLLKEKIADLEKRITSYESNQSVQSNTQSNVQSNQFNLQNQNKNYRKKYNQFNNNNFKHRNGPSQNYAIPIEDHNYYAMAQMASMGTIHPPNHFINENIMIQYVPVPVHVPLYPNTYDQDYNGEYNGVYNGEYSEENNESYIQNESVHENI